MLTTDHGHDLTTSVRETRREVMCERGRSIDRQVEFWSAVRHHCPRMRQTCLNGLTANKNRVTAMSVCALVSRPLSSVFSHPKVYISKQIHLIFLITILHSPSIFLRNVQKPYNSHILPNHTPHSTPHESTLFKRPSASSYHVFPANPLRSLPSHQRASTRWKHTTPLLSTSDIWRFCHLERVGLLQQPQRELELERDDTAEWEIAIFEQSWHMIDFLHVTGIDELGFNDRGNAYM
ncbi:hypothetical protein BDW02DRAFT_351629 [Decorospora gaudefroyi]|uniref:Uncharacterized protein n=1 Tax=Decorospora gaudefroyi TaxID=184978 RepID=A0A6A5KFQ6_9PLEO|nr:hypothetical protein BDW02DRAFT_351629 [Decorospora gaudefroyi]